MAYSHVFLVIPVEHNPEMAVRRMGGRRVFTFNTASFLLASSMFATGATGLVLEYIQGTVGTYILGNSIEQYSIVIGLMLFMMGVAAKVQTYFSDSLLIEKFILIEIFLAVIGGYQDSLLFAAGVLAVGVLATFIGGKTRPRS